MGTDPCLAVLPTLNAAPLAPRLAVLDVDEEGSVGRKTYKRCGNEGVPIARVKPRVMP